MSHEFTAIVIKDDEVTSLYLSLYSLFLDQVSKTVCFKTESYKKKLAFCKGTL